LLHRFQDKTIKNGSLIFIYHITDPINFPIITFKFHEYFKVNFFTVLNPEKNLRGLIAIKCRFCVFNLKYGNS